MQFPVFLLDHQTFPQKEKYNEERRTLPNVLTTKEVVPSQKAPTMITKNRNTPMMTPTATRTGTMMTRVLNGAVHHGEVRRNIQTCLTRLAVGDSACF